MPDSNLYGDLPVEDGAPSRRACRVLVANETPLDVAIEPVQAAVEAAFAGSDYTSISVSVAIVDDEAIHELNRQFLDHDYPTDVLSFPLEDQPPLIEGEIVVSVDTAARCAQEAGWTPHDELLLYITHGALHLAGFGDKEPLASRAMRSREAAILAELGIAVPAHDSRWNSDLSEEPSP